MAAKKTPKPAAPKPCPPGNHRMPDGTCMPDSQMPRRTSKPVRRTPRKAAGY